ncbi:hypothetical protein P3W33_12070 [Luteibacter sp. PPL552]|jgi:hypothetical protein
MVVIKEGTLIEPNIRDAHVMGIVLDKKDRALLPLEDVDGRALCIVMDGVVRLKADNFNQGNTLLSVSVSVGPSLNIGDVAEAYGVSTANQDFLPQAMERLASEGFTVVRMSPSNGCSMVRICRHVNPAPMLM